MAYPPNMCLLTLSVGLKIRIILLLVLFLCTSDVSSKCGCHRVPGQGGFFVNNRQAAGNHNFESLQQTIHPNSDGSSSGNGGGMQYSVPNFRVLLFQPTFLDFREQAVGMPYVQSVVLSNPSDQNDIEITDVNALPPFHSSRFTKQVLPPKGNMTIDLVFLSTMIGNVEHTVYIYTSKGNFPYQVFGIGKANPYRLRSFISARIPINGTFSPYINMYNPHSHAIQISEMYSSGNDLHLDILGHTETDDHYGKLWEIPPYETKAVMKATFFPKEHGINVRFIRIKLSAPAPPDDVLIIPFEMLVSKDSGIYTNIDMLDFGTLRTMDEPKSLNLNALNFGNKTLKVVSIQVVPPNKAVSVLFSPMALKSSKKHTKIASIVFSASHATHKRQNTGKIVVYTNEDKKRMEIPYQANILHGTVAYSVGRTSFFVGQSPTTQVLTITNTFNSTLVIYNATLPSEVSHIFQINNFTKGIMIPSGKLVSPLSISFTANVSDLHLSTVLRLYTNASIFTIPVHCYNGKLKYEVESLNEDVLDYGTVGTLENRTLTFRIINRNPVEVSIKEYGTEFEYARLQLVHIKSAKASKMAKRSKWFKNRVCTDSRVKDCSPRDQIHDNGVIDQKQGDPIVLRPSDIVTFTVDITAPKNEGTYQADITMQTMYETIQIPIYLKTVKGSLISKPKKIRIEKAFPGRTENYPLSMESTFEYTITLQNLSVFPEDPRFTFVKPDALPKLLPKEKTHIGWVKFDPFFGDESQCYLCVCVIDAACEHWHHSLTLPEDSWELDFNLLEKLRRKWDAVENKQESNFNASIIVDSSVIKRYTIPVQASLAWPTLVEQSIKFPPTHVGNFSMEEMTITNPSDHPLLVQVIPLMNYPQPEGGLDLISDRLIMDSFSLDLNGHSSFFIPEIRDGTQDHSKVSNSLHVYPSPNSLSLLLEPRQKKIVNIAFMPEDEKPKTSIMVVRNNLTILDLVVVQGQGAYTNFNINNNPPGGKKSILLFEIKPIHLKDCNKSTPKARVYPSFTVKRSFTAQNVGQLPVHVVSMNVNNYECEGYGFRILNCESFVLMPNSSRRIDITFIPDFTTSRVTRTLRVLTTMGQSLDFILLATLPHHMLPLCAEALPRPFWEPYLHIVAAIIMSTVFIFIIFFAYFDAQKYVVQCTFTAGSSGGSAMEKDMDVYTAGTVFDLKAIAGVKVRITDKKEKYDSKSHLRLSKATSLPATSSPKTTSPVVKLNTSETRDRTNSESSTGSSRKDSSTVVPEERIEQKLVKEPADTPPKRTSRRRTHDHMRNTTRVRQYEEPREPVIVTEEIRDPWERDLMEKVRSQRLKTSGGDELRNRRKSKSVKKEEANHRSLQKENSNGSSNNDEERIEEKPVGFTTVEGKGKVKKKMDLIHSNSYPLQGSNTLDRLDEISLSGPRPDGKEQPRKPIKSNESKSKNRKKLPHQHDRLVMDTPTSPHAIAAAIVEAALVKSQQKKKSKGNKGNNSPINSRNSPKNREDSSSEAKKSKKESSGWGSYFRKFGINLGNSDKTDEQSPTSGSSMFFYDNLASLRESRQVVPDNDFRAPGSKIKKNSNNGGVTSSTLSPDSAEFVPASYRMNRAVGSNLKKDNSWATVDDSVLDSLRPPPGFSKPARSIWGGDDAARIKEDEDVWSGSNSSLFDFKNPFKNESSYSSLLGGTSRSNDVFSGLDLLSSRAKRSDSTNLWKGSDNDFSASIEKDLWIDSSANVRSSIWDTPETILPPTSSGNTTARSRLGLDLDLKPVNEGGLSDPDSPLDAFSIWASNVDPASPYEGWNQDIKEE